MENDILFYVLCLLFYVLCLLYYLFLLTVISQNEILADAELLQLNAAIG